jgi:ATP-dependent DNA ligase
LRAIIAKQRGHAAKLNFEGIVSKRADAPYRSERTEAWLKIKTVQKGKFPVFGFVKDPTGVAALYLGKREGKDLVYMGKVGTGWSRRFPARSESNSTPSSDRNPNSQNRSENRRPRGLSRHSSPMLNSAISRRKGCFGKAPSRA